MKICCTETFKSQFEKLVKSNAYKSLQQEIIDYFFNDNTSMLSGTRLNCNAPDPFLKKRLKGSGGFRTYYYIVIKDNCLYLAFVHPKTGKYGMDNISDNLKYKLAKEVLEAIKSATLYDMSVDEDKGIIVFRKR